MRAPHIETRGFVLGRVAYGEADLIVTLFTEELGKLSGIARGARRGGKKFSGSLEPMHTVQLQLAEKRSSDLCAIKDATISQPRLGITSELDRMEAAGRALSWVKRVAPARTAEPGAFLALDSFLNGLDEATALEVSPDARLTAFGVQLMTTFGWGLELERCVRCGKACPEQSAALLSPERGGIVCRSCGGGPLKISAPLRAGLRAAGAGRLTEIPADELSSALRVVERSLGAHAGVNLRR